MVKYNYCECGNVIGNKSSACQKCAGLKNRKTSLPPDKEIMEMLKSKSITKVAAELGVSKTTISKIKLRYRDK